MHIHAYMNILTHTHTWASEGGVKRGHLHPLDFENVLLIVLIILVFNSKWLWNYVKIYWTLLTVLWVKNIGVDFLGGSQGMWPPIIEKRPCVYHFLPTFPPNILVCPPKILTSLRQWLKTVRLKNANKLNRLRELKFVFILQIISQVLSFTVFSHKQQSVSGPLEITRPQLAGWTALV